MKPRTPRAPLRPNHAVRPKREPGTREIYAALCACWPARLISAPDASQLPRIRAIAQGSRLTAALEQWQGVRVDGRRIVSRWDPRAGVTRWWIVR